MSFSNLLRSTMQRTLERTTLSEPHIFFALFLPASSWKKRFYAQCNTEFCTWIAQLFECILYATWRKNVQKYAMRTRECDQHVQFSIVHCSPPQYFKVPPSRIKTMQYMQSITVFDIPLVKSHILLFGTHKALHRSCSCRRFANANYLEIQIQR